MIKIDEKLTVRNVLIFKFLDGKLEDKRICTEAFPDFNLLKLY
jgi:hypothetical protein